MHRIECPNCNGVMKYGDEHAGKMAKCRKCGHAVQLPPVAASGESGSEELTEWGAPTPETARSESPRPLWTPDGSSKKVIIWCEAERSAGDDADDASRIRRFRGHEVVVHFPPCLGRHVVSVTCPRCGKAAHVLVEVSDEIGRKRWMRRVLVPATAVLAAGWWSLSLFGWDQRRGEVDWWIGLVVYVLLGLASFGGIFPALAIYGAFFSSKPGLEGMVANMLPPPEEMEAKPPEKLTHHSVGCVKGGNPDWLSWGGSPAEWERSNRRNTRTADE